MTTALMPHQAQAVEWIHKVGRGLLGDPPGLGKTRVAIEAFDGGKVLVVAPTLVINGGTWEDELAKWAKHPEGFQVVPYSMLNAREKLDPNRPSTTRAINKLRDEVKGRYDALIVDEAHYTKGRKTSWTWAVKTIAKNSGSLLEMTGTPVPNWAHELFTILQAIYPERSKPGGDLGSYWRWVEDWFRVSPSPFSDTAKNIGGLKACSTACKKFDPADPCPHYLEFMDANIGDRFLRRRREDVLQLPPVSFQDVAVPMTTDQKRAYREMKKDYLTTVDDEEVVAWSEGAKNVRLDKITTSPWLLTMKGPPRGGKLEMLRFDLEGRSQPTVVFAHYRDSVEAAAQVARDCGLRVGVVHGGVSKKNQGLVVKEFKAGNLDVICGSLETMAEGLQLTIADMLIFLEVSYKPSRNEQARYRIDRMGQDRPVVVRNYITPDTVDERKRVLLENKTDQQMRLMSARDFASLI